jgi:Ca-activated chloride channel family protein
MHRHIKRTRSVIAVGLLGLLLLAFPLQAQSGNAHNASTRSSAASTEAQVRIPIRPQAPLFEGQQGKQKTEIHFDPATGIVTLKLLVQDPNGNFIPNIGRGSFVVYENGVRQQNASVEIEHAPVSLALLMELGGRYPALNKSFAQEISRASHQILDILGQEDKLALWTYGDALKQAADFTSNHAALESVLYAIQPPSVSEINLYDALVSACERIKRVAGRKAILLLSSGVDTFSKATFDDALETIRNSNTPIYVISMAPTFREMIQLRGPADAMAAIDSKKVENQLMEIARVSGGRFYAPDSMIDLSGVYDDIMENLKVRYVVTYKSSVPADEHSPRTVRVELVNPSTGGRLQIVDAKGNAVRAKVIAEGSYTP